MYLNIYQIVKNGKLRGKKVYYYYYYYYYLWNKNLEASLLGKSRSQFPQFRVQNLRLRRRRRQKHTDVDDRNLAGATNRRVFDDVGSRRFIAVDGHLENIFGRIWRRDRHFFSSAKTTMIEGARVRSSPESRFSPVDYELMAEHFYSD